MTNTVLVTDHDFTDLSIERERLSDLAEVVELSDDTAETTADEHARLAEADAVINLRYDLDTAAVKALADCRVIARYGIGVDNIDTETAAKCSIPVTNVPTYCIEEVSTHSLTLMLSFARGIKCYDASVSAGEWERGVAPPIHRFSTQTVGVVGYGAIGREVGARADALGASVVASDPFLTQDDVADDPATLVSFEELLAEADFVTVHSPLTDETRGMLNSDAFQLMQDSAVLINVARGPIVDIDALRAALDAGEIAGAGLDVFPDEPPAVEDPLRTHERVLATPHVAWYSEEANEERRHTVANIVAAALEGEEIRNIVNSVK